MQTLIKTFTATPPVNLNRISRIRDDIGSSFTPAPGGAKNLYSQSFPIDIQIL